MKVRDHRIYNFKLVSWEDINRGRARVERDSISSYRRAFERADRCRSHCNHPPARCFRLVDGIGGLLRKFAPLGVDLVLFGTLLGNGGKCVEANVKRDKGTLHAFGL